MEYFDYEYRVTYGDTDMMGISYYANYFVWFEAARTEYFRALGWSYRDFEKQGYFLPVAETSARYKGSSTYDDLLLIRTSVADIGRTSMTFEYQVLEKSSGRLLTTGFSRHVCVDRNMKPCRLPEDIARRVTVHKLLPA